MPVAISDSSTLIHLAAIGRLDLLREFYDKILIAPAVWDEVVENGRGMPGALEVEMGRNSGWIDVASPANRPLIRLLEQELHKGESETIALAVEMSPDVVLLDETDARRSGKIYGLRMTGIIGILIRARLEGKISSLKADMDKLRNDAGFWISDETCRMALKHVGDG